MPNSNSRFKYSLSILAFAIIAGLILHGLSSVKAAEPVTVTFTVTTEQTNRNYSYALGKLLGQKPFGSGDPVNEFSIITTADYDKLGNFLGTYTITIPDGRATKAQVQAVLNDPKPEQPPIIKTRLDELLDLLINDTITLRQIAELLRLERGLP